jgi:ribokinase
MVRVVVVGSVNMDLVTTCFRLPAPGETVLGEQHAIIPGGKGANQAIAAARSGAQSWLVGAVGNDSYGALLRANLSNSGVHDNHLRTAAGPSGIATISVDNAGENNIIVIGGANRTFTALTDADLALIADCDVLLCQLELPLHVVAEATRHARLHETTVMLNPSPVQPLDRALLGNVDVLVANQDECAQLGHRALGAVRHVVTTMGARGVHYRGPGGFTLDVRAPKVDTVDTTGAGDAFTGALAATWTQDPLDALQWAAACAALSTTRRGAYAPNATGIADLLSVQAAKPRSHALM